VTTDNKLEIKVESSVEQYGTKHLFPSVFFWPNTFLAEKLVYVLLQLAEKPAVKLIF